MSTGPFDDGPDPEPVVNPVVPYITDEPDDDEEGADEDA